MSYAEAVRQLYDLGYELHRTPAHKFDLAHMRTLLCALGNPHQHFKSILIAGTNGKGSTAATLASILLAAEHRTGLYTSPHLIRINERIQLCGTEIDDNDFARVYDEVEAAARRLVSAGDLPWHPSFFEMLTAMAFTHFAASKIEVAVLEVGLGGRLDATNVVEPNVSVITDISLDHEKFLGSTIAEIAAEKAGIIRAVGVLVTLPQHPQANQVIGNRAMELGTRAVSAVPYVPPVSPNAVGVYGRTRESDHDDDAPQASLAIEGRDLWRNHYDLDVLGERINVDSPLVGRHQVRNLALAIGAAVELNALGIGITAQAVERGIRDTRWPGRFQTLTRHDAPVLVFDVAHNPDGAWALRAALNDRYPEADITMVFGAMGDKNIEVVAQVLFPLAKRVIVTEARNPRAATAAELANIGGRWCDDLQTAADVPAALRRADAITPKSALVVVTGSIYIVGEALQYLDESAAHT